MIKRLLIYVLLLASVSAGAIPCQRKAVYVVKTVDGFPSDEKGYELGVSACYAGRIGDELIIAGGCNFPEQGAPKKYYQGIYAAKADTAALTWRLIGYLPEPAAYGGVVESGDSLVFVGGNNSEHSLRSVFSLHVVDGKAVIHQMPSLPVTADNMAVAGDGKNIYVFGGNQNGKASGNLLKYNLKNKSGWQTLAVAPDKPRVQPVAVAVKNKVYVLGGFYADGDNSITHTDGYCYNAKKQTWQHIDSPVDADGNAITYSGGIATLSNGNGIICLGGVNKDIFTDAISGRHSLVSEKDYLSKPVAWYRFNPHAMFYAIARGKWFPLITDKSLARAGAQIVNLGNIIYYIGGELKPGARTPQIVILRRHFIR